MIKLPRIIALLIISQPLILEAAESSLGNGSVDAMAFVKMFLGLLFTVAIIFLLAWLSRKTKLINTLNAGYQIKTLATQSLTHREKICLVEVGGKQILIGLAPGNINKLHVFDEPVEEITSVQETTSATDFATQFKRAVGIQAREQKD